MVEQLTRICFFGTYRADYSRNRNMLKSLQLAGFEVVDCHAKLWQGIEDRVNTVSGGWRRPRFWIRVVKAYLQLLRRYQEVGEYDLLFVGYPGQFDIFLARMLSRRRRKPLVWDVFMSIYLIALERGLAERSPFTVRGLQKIERLALSLPDMLLQDTKEYVTWLGETYGIDEERFRLVATGADNTRFRPTSKEESSQGRILVVYYGTFIPNHGVRKIIEAARYFKEADQIDLVLIGEGPEKAHAVADAARNSLDIEFREWMTPDQLIPYLSKVDILLGAFGDTPQSLMTVQNKIYEGLALGKPVLTGASPAVRRQFTHGENIYLRDRSSPREIAQAIKDLARDAALRQKIAEGGYELFQAEYSLEKMVSGWPDT